MNKLVFEHKEMGKYDAGSKARNDVEEILLSMDFIRTDIYGKKNNNVFGKIFSKLDLVKQWNNNLVKNSFNDNIFIQYPFKIPNYFMKKIIRKSQKNNNKIIFIIHDLESIRVNKKDVGSYTFKRINYNDKVILKTADKIICHNDSMKKELIKWGINSEKILCLNIFDYLDFNYPKDYCIAFNKPIIIAGNLVRSKSGYIYELNKIKKQFNLYGAGFEEYSASSNIIYKGKFLPEKLIENLEGSFGLVWDGPTIETCSGTIGNYLQYNNPHKVSLYISSGIPIIIWSKSAMANYIKKNNLGIVVETLNDLDKELKKIDEKQYTEMKKNAYNLSKKLKNGEMLKNVIKEII